MPPSMPEKWGISWHFTMKKRKKMGSDNFLTIDKWEK
jgi:hypothetical protein